MTEKPKTFRQYIEWEIGLANEQMCNGRMGAGEQELFLFFGHRIAKLVLDRAEEMGILRHSFLTKHQLPIGPAKHDDDCQGCEFRAIFERKERV